MKTDTIEKAIDELQTAKVEAAKQVDEAILQVKRAADNRREQSLHRP